MTTDLKRFNEAYATMTVAAYEPMILHWISLIGIRFISNEVAYRQAKSAARRRSPAARRAAARRAVRTKGPQTRRAAARRAAQTRKRRRAAA